MELNACHFGKLSSLLMSITGRIWLLVGTLFFLQSVAEQRADASCGDYLQRHTSSQSNASIELVLPMREHQSSVPAQLPTQQSQECHGGNCQFPPSAPMLPPTSTFERTQSACLLVEQEVHLDEFQQLLDVIGRAPMAGHTPRIDRPPRLS